MGNQTAQRHVLKTWPEYFDALRTGAKTFEARKDDRNFQVGDELTLREYNTRQFYYTGREVVRRVTYIMRGPAFGVEAGWCVMALSGPIVRINDQHRQKSPGMESL